MQFNQNGDLTLDPSIEFFTESDCPRHMASRGSILAEIGWTVTYEVISGQKLPKNCCGQYWFHKEVEKFPESPDSEHDQSRWALICTQSITCVAKYTWNV